MAHRHTFAGLCALTAAVGLLGGGAGLAPAADDDLKDPVIKILGPQGKLNFEVRPRRGSCDVFVPAEIRIRLRGEGFKKTFVLDEPCGDWTRGSKSAPNLRFTREDGTGYRAARLKLKAVGDEEVKRRYRYDIRMDGELTDKGAVRVDVREGDDGEMERYVYLEDPED
ncbi:MAG TPA: hypothetical protein VF533_24190 [Solirubrobacteraceae bacterium]|jgi:hypothetical protein